MIDAIIDLLGAVLRTPKNHRLLIVECALSNTGGLPAPTREVETLVDLIGSESALKLIERFGGTRIYVPSRNVETSVLASVVGQAAATTLSDKFGSMQLMVPAGRQWRVLIYRSRGMTVSDIARNAGLHERSVYRILVEYGVERRDGMGISGRPKA